MINKTCAYCGKDFGIKPYRKLTAKFCSRECLHKSTRTRIEKSCLVCNKKFKVYKCHLKRGGKFCSRKCFFEYRKGKSNYVRTDEIKKKIADAHRKDGKIIDGYGYVLVYVPDYPYQTKVSGGRIWEHRYMMEKHLGRPLEPNELVHHINGIKTDNRIKNLMLLKNHGEHLKEHNYLHKIAAYKK